MWFSCQIHEKVEETGIWRRHSWLSLLFEIDFEYCVSGREEEEEEEKVRERENKK